MTWPDLLPPTALRITCGTTTLSAMTPDDVAEVLDLAVEGVVDPDRPYPFITDWARLPEEDLRPNTAEYYFSTFATWTRPQPERWVLLMVTRVDGEVVGCQDLFGRSVALTGLVRTGSWLGRTHHGRGIGTLMRQMACVFAFDHLGVAEMRTEAYEDNPSSQRVSTKVGYERIDSEPVARLGEPAREVRFRLTADRLVRPTEPVVVEGADSIRWLAGL